MLNHKRVWLPIKMPETIKRESTTLLTMLACVVVFFTAGMAHAANADKVGLQLERRFQDTVRPFLGTYCVTCHEGEKPKGDFDLGPYRTSKEVARDAGHWEMVLDKLQTGDMPPKKAKQHPTPEQSKAVVAWVQELRRYEAERNAGDPGPVLARRLSNAEYDYTIRDLTGVDLRPTKEFPVDPANQDGFDNSGESLAMSPALLKKYLLAARQVADHLILKPDGLDFAEFPMMADTDRDKYGVLRIVDFYKRQPTDLAAYFEAAWRYRHRRALGQRWAKLAEVAAQMKVSPAYLELVWTTLNDPMEKVGPIAKLQTLWNGLPVPARGQTNAAGTNFVAMRNFVATLRKKLVPDVPNLSAPGVNEGSQCFVLWKDRQMAANRRRYDPKVLQAEGTVFETVAESATNAPPAGKKKSRRQPKPKPIPDADLTVPAEPAQRAVYEAAFARFCSIFPDAFYISERARVWLSAEEEKDNGGRLLSAGFHSMTGFFRDDGPLYDMILDERQRRELDRLWVEFEMISAVPQRMHTSFIWFERAEGQFLINSEFDFARSEDKDCTSEANVRKLGELYLAKAKRVGANEIALTSMREHFAQTAANLRRAEKLRAEAEPRHLEDLLKFAERAYRRPLSKAEREDILAFYKTLRERDGLEHEDALRDSVVSVLMSPHFCYRIDLVEAAGLDKPRRSSKAKPTGSHGAVALSDYALASRLSYFLWSAPPDEALLARAAAGDLHRPEVIAAQARRMLQDEKVRGLAVEFGGHWLDFRRFEEHNAVDRERFPMFNDELRQAMFEEPVRFLLNVVRENRPVLDFLNADYTFVNPVLAKHYGLTIPPVASNQWVKAEHVRESGRGGLLPMSVFLTANSPGLRTSPVKRGNWVAKRVLGERIPPPPAVVPELPADEAKMGELTLRETLEKHRADLSCAGCHKRFDSLGLVFEGFGPVGEVRAKDLGGKPVDVHATFPDGSDGSGIEGLRAYILAQRREDFVDNLCRKLLAYALGRSLILSDDITVREMKARLAARGGRFNTLVESIVTSPQFLYKRSLDDVATN